jgi:peptidoglycan/LPS O-acetylase OafA/YrhL
MTPNHRPDDRLFGLDLLRAGAALMVLLAHSVFFVWTLREDWRIPLYLASLAIDGFFVLTGFLLGRALLVRGEAAGAWWRQRLARIVPLYLLFVAINAVLAARGGADWPDWFAHALFVQNLGSSTGAFMPESWNLSVWFWFLALATPALALFARGPRAPQRAAALALGLIACGIAVRVAWVLVFDPSWDEGTKKLVLTRLDACAYGLLVAAGLAARPRWFAASGAWALAGLALLAGSIALHAAGDIDHGFAERAGGFVLSGLGWALCLPWLLARRPAPSAATRGIGALARWSYLMYLVHFVLIRLVEPHWVRAGDWTSGALHIAGYVAATILSAAALHRLLERPLRALRPAGRA